jgi:hypothetical protein
MYYSFPCTYCQRVFYTYDSDKHRAARTLYRTIKQHLIDYKEDEKEYELDDGEQLDTNQIYDEMKTSLHAPAGGYQATKTNSVVYATEEKEVPVAHASPHHTSAKAYIIMVLIFLILLLGAFSLFLFFPDTFNLQLPNLAL